MNALAKRHNKWNACHLGAKGPASLALESLESRITLEPPGLAFPQLKPIARTPMINLINLKRSRRKSGTFNLAELEEASKKVEEAIAFPEIEWPTFEGDDCDSQPEESPQPMMKRPRLGLVRSSHSFNLAALSSSERINSSGDDDLC